MSLLIESLKICIAQRKNNVMKNLSMLSKQATNEQIEANAVTVSKNVNNAKKAERTFMNSSVLRNNTLTDTARLDFVLCTALVLTDFCVTSQQCVALASTVELDSKRLQSAKQIEKHVRDKELFSCENSVFTINDEQLKEFYINAFYSQAHMQQLEKHASILFSLVVNHIADNAIIENAHEQSLTMNRNFDEAKTKKAKANAVK